MQPFADALQPFFDALSRVQQFIAGALWRHFPRPPASEDRITECVIRDRMRDFTYMSYVQSIFLIQSGVFVSAATALLHIILYTPQLAAG